MQTVANYEKGKTGMAAAETAVRAIYTLHILPPEAQGSVIRNFVDAIMTSRPDDEAVGAVAEEDHRLMARGRATEGRA